MLMRKCLLAMLILMLLNLNTDYTDSDADLCIRIMSLCCMETSALPMKAANFDLCSALIVIEQ